MNSTLLENIIKPTLVLDENKVRENIHFMAEKARRSNVIFRPHFKTHQSREIGRWFRDEDVRQITVSSVDMAEYFIKDGWDNITIAFPLNFRQLPQINELAQMINLGILVENIEAIHALGSLDTPLNIWIKIDTGLHRTGIEWNSPRKLKEILDTSEKYPKLNINGLVTHAGHTYSAKTAEEAVQIHNQSIKYMNDLRQFINKPHLLISVGDTPGCSQIPEFSAIDEIRPGNFIFFDAEQLEIGSCKPEQISVALFCPIVASHPERNEVVIYGGAVHLSKEMYIHSDQPCYGLVASLDSNKGWGELLQGCTVTRLSQEHGVLSIPKTMMDLFHPGDLIPIIPVHSCLTAHLMRRYLCLDGHMIDMMPI